MGEALRGGGVRERLLLDQFASGPALSFAALRRSLRAWFRLARLASSAFFSACRGASSQRSRFFFSLLICTVFAAHPRLCFLAACSSFLARALASRASCFAFRVVSWRGRQLARCRHIVHSFARCLGSVQAHAYVFFKQIHAVSCGSHALTAALETWSAFASVIACGIASFELLCAWRFRFQARASCATKTSWFSSGLGVEGTSCSRSHNPGGNRTAMLRQGPLFNLSDVSLRIGHTSLSWTTVHEISRGGTTRPSPQLPLAWHAWPRLFRFWVFGADPANKHTIDPFCKTSSPITITIYTRFKTSSTKTHELHCFSDFLHQNLTIPPIFSPVSPSADGPAGNRTATTFHHKDTFFSLAFSPFPLQQHGACAVFQLLQNIRRITLPQRRTRGESIAYRHRIATWYLT